MCVCTQGYTHFCLCSRNTSAFSTTLIANSCVCVRERGGHVGGWVGVDAHQHAYLPTPARMTAYTHYTCDTHIPIPCTSACMHTRGAQVREINTSPVALRVALRTRE